MVVVIWSWKQKDKKSKNSDDINPDFNYVSWTVAKQRSRLFMKPPAEWIEK